MIFLIGPFFAVSKPILVTKGSFESSRRDLQDTHHSADLRNQNFNLKSLSKIAKVQIFASGGDKKSKAMKSNYENFPLVPRGGSEPLYLENLLKILAPVNKLH